MAKWDNGFDTFMDTEKESEKWHTGIFRGIKIGAKVGLKAHDPRKLKKAIRARKYKLTKEDALRYYHNDEHYHDIPALFIALSVYGITKGIEAGVIMKAFGYLAPLLTG